MKQALLIFAKNLIYGKVKTRLAATMGNDLALSVYKQLLSYTQHITFALSFGKIVFYSDFMEKDDIWGKEDFQKQIQIGNDLGERIENAFEYAFHQNHNKVVIIGTDCVELTSDIINKAFNSLDDHDVVIGPAKDGGYYLLGIKKLNAELFKKISWSTGDVLNQTLWICKKLNLTVFLLPELSDIDNEEDYKRALEKYFLIKIS